MRLSTFHLPAMAPERPTRCLPALLDVVEAADHLGYDSAWITEHHGGEHAVTNPLLVLVHLAARTANLRLGTAVLPAPLWPVDRLVEDLRTVDELLGDRLRIGIGRNATGRRPQPSDEEDFASLVRSLEPIVGAGRLWEAATTPDGVDRVIAGERNLLFSPPLRRLEAIADAKSRLVGDGQRELAVTAFVLVDDDPAAAITPGRIFDQAELAALAETGGPPTSDPSRIASRLIAGRPDVVRAWIDSLADAGVDELLLCTDLPGTSTSQAIDTLAALAPVTSGRR
ncbi:MAG: LLM class flavin-dependent oxidoreductase [Actinomycetota bacterium]